MCPSITQPHLLDVHRYNCTVLSVEGPDVSDALRQSHVETRAKAHITHWALRWQLLNPDVVAAAEPDSAWHEADAACLERKHHLSVSVANEFSQDAPVGHPARNERSAARSHQDPPPPEQQAVPCNDDQATDDQRNAEPVAKQPAATGKFRRQRALCTWRLP